MYYGTVTRSPFPLLIFVLIKDQRVMLIMLMMRVMEYEDGMFAWWWHRVTAGDSWDIIWDYPCGMYVRYVSDI